MQPYKNANREQLPSCGKSFRLSSVTAVNRDVTACLVELLLQYARRLAFFLVVRKVIKKTRRKIVGASYQAG